MKEPIDPNFLRHPSGSFGFHPSALPIFPPGRASFRSLRPSPGARRAFTAHCRGSGRSVDDVVLVFLGKRTGVPTLQVAFQEVSYVIEGVEGTKSYQKQKSFSVFGTFCWHFERSPSSREWQKERPFFSFTGGRSVVEADLLLLRHMFWDRDPEQGGVRGCEHPWAGRWLKIHRKIQENAPEKGVNL